MTQKTNKKMDMQTLSDLAFRYRELALEVKGLEAEIKPIKDAIVSECRAQGITGTLDLDAILVVSQTRTTQKIDQNAVTPDWLYRFQNAGGKMTAKLDVSPEQFDKMTDLLSEVSFSETATQAYTLKLKA